MGPQYYSKNIDFIPSLKGYSVLLLRSLLHC